MAVNPYAVSTSSRHASGTASSSVSEREDLANFISMITRDETPFMSSIGKTKATAVYHEWQTDELSAPINAQLADGTDIGEVRNDGANSTDDVNAGLNYQDRTRLGNFTQINGKKIAVSGTKRAVDQAGVADEYAYQLKKKGTELRRDVEFQLLSANVASGSGTRTFGGVASWINVPTTAGAGQGTVLYKTDSGWAAPAVGSRGEGSAAPVYTSGDDTSTNKGLALSDVDDVMQAIYQAGGKGNRLMVSPRNRRAFSSRVQAEGNVRRNVDEMGSLRQSVDVYMSDFGDVMVEANYIMGLAGDRGAATDSALYNDEWALIYDPMWFNIATLRPLQEVDVGQRGDSTIGMMVEECTLEVRNPIGCGAIYGLDGS